MKEEVSLEGMPPIKKPRKKVAKKFHSNKNVPVETAVRRQVAQEIGEDEPTKDQKFILLQKYGAVAPRIDRLATKPSWMEVVEWKRRQNDWFKMTKGLVSPSQRPKFRPMNSQESQLPKQGFRPYQKPKPFSLLRNQLQGRLQVTNKFRPNSGPTPTATRLN